MLVPITENIRETGRREYRMKAIWRLLTVGERYCVYMDLNTAEVFIAKVGKVEDHQHVYMEFTMDSNVRELDKIVVDEIKSHRSPDTIAYTTLKKRYGKKADTIQPFAEVCNPYYRSGAMMKLYDVWCSEWQINHQHNAIVMRIIERKHPKYRVPVVDKLKDVVRVNI